MQNDPNDPFTKYSKARDNPEILLEIDAQLAENPSLLFLRILAMLDALPGKVDNAIPIHYPVELVLTPDFIADASARRMRGFCRRYQIRINSGFYYLLNDVAEITVAQERMYSKSGEVVTLENFSPEELKEILKESVKEYVNKENIWQPSQKLAKNNRERLLRELRWQKSRRRDIIHHGRRVCMAVFVLGHELGHVVAGHCDPPELFSKKREKTTSHEQELVADLYGAKFLTDFVSVPPPWWENKWETTEDGDLFTEICLNGARSLQEKTQYMHGDYASLMQRLIDPTEVATLNRTHNLK
jgi:hypothetical protein